jgi:uncharacterized membrane protein YesL
MNGFVAGYYKLALWITRLAYLNALWILFTIIGIGLFGFFPATSGMFEVVRKWVQGENDIPIYKHFWKTFKKEFIKINLMGYMFVSIGYFLTIEFMILRNQEHITYLIASFGVLGLLIIYLIILLYLFPIYSEFELKFFHYIKWSVFIGIAHPILTIFLAGIIIVIVYFIYITIPVLLFLFGGSVSAFILTWGASQAFNNIQYTEPQNNVD